jgi:WhiB family redox-sensing transcriptional regulator
MKPEAWHAESERIGRLLSFRREQHLALPAGDLLAGVWAEEPVRKGDHVVNIDVVAPLEDCVRSAMEIDLLRPSWMRKAACRGQGFDFWFPPDELGEEADAARRVCAGCPVSSECLDYALEGRIRHGLWGGLSPRERAALNRRLIPKAKAAASPRYSACGR